MSSLKSKKVGYLLVVLCDSAVNLPLKAVNPVLPKGCYLYIGSANIRNPLKRIERHFKKYKKLHWHIDYLTTMCKPLASLIFYGVSEDELYTIISGRNTTQPVKGFGNTDKRRHISHLFRISSAACDPSKLLALVFEMFPGKRSSLEFYLP